MNYATISQCRAIFDYDSQSKELVDRCNLCGAWPSSTKLISSIDRYGFNSEWVECCCGLDYLSYRMTREAYARFYESGAYRKLVSAFHGREINAQALRDEQVPYAVRLTGYLESWMGVGPLRFGKMPQTLLDIGGSTGVVAHRIAGSFMLAGTVLEPSLAEGMFAAGYGLNIVPGTIEDFNTDKRWDLITLCQTADHLLDLMGSLKKIKGLLSPDGLFWSDIVDFEVTREVKIDHPFNLTEKTYRQFLTKAGFKLLQINYAPDGRHIGFLCRAAE